MAHAAPRLLHGAACACDHCVAKHNTVADCESFGVDCACHAGYDGDGGGAACADFGDRTARLRMRRRHRRPRFPTATPRYEEERHR